MLDKLKRIFENKEKKRARKIEELSQLIMSKITMIMENNTLVDPLFILEQCENKIEKLELDKKKFLGEKILLVTNEYIKKIEKAISPSIAEEELEKIVRLFKEFKKFKTNKQKPLLNKAINSVKSKYQESLKKHDTKVVRQRFQEFLKKSKKYKNVS